ncbi:hypothetical protein PTI98_007628 [Pleurotus ostreatus]|nr:hypothetical protein PTI98_007628 [Pleurotus ostreatus]
MATTAHTHTSANGRTSPIATLHYDHTLNTRTYNYASVRMEGMASAHRRTTSVDSSYSAFFTSGLLSPPSSPAMSPTSPTSPSSLSISPFSYPSSAYYNPPSSSRHNPKSSRMQMKVDVNVNVNVNPSRQLPSTSMLELASPSEAYGGDALYFVALLQQMEDDESDIGVGGEQDDVEDVEDKVYALYEDEDEDEVCVLPLLFRRSLP